MSPILRAAVAFFHGLFRSRLSMLIERFMAAILAEAAEVGGLHHHYERAAA
jgi:hypothetical protein